MDDSVLKERGRLEGVFQTVLWFYGAWSQRSVLCVVSKVGPSIQATCKWLLPLSTSKTKNKWNNGFVSLIVSLGLVITCCAVAAAVVIVIVCFYLCGYRMCLCVVQLQ